MYLLSPANGSAGKSTASVSSGLGVIMTTFAQIVFTDVNDYSAADNAVSSREGDNAVLGIKNTLSVGTNSDVALQNCEHKT